MTMTSFKNKTVLITGASAGVGAACARYFANAGANLALVARGEPALFDIANQLRHQTNVITIVADVADMHSCEQMVSEVIKQCGKIDVLINNAGLHHRGEFASLNPDQVANMVDVNLRAPLYLSALTLPYLKAVGSGAIVMVGSLAGRAPLQGAACYASTKAGLRAFTYSLADELRGSGVAVGVVSPGPINTGFIMDSIDEVEDIVYSQPMSTAEQVAENIAKIASGASIEITMTEVSGKLTTLAYLFPRLRRALRKSLYAKGRKNKEKYRQVSKP